MRGRERKLLKLLGYITICRGISPEAWVQAWVLDEGGFSNVNNVNINTESIYHSAIRRVIRDTPAEILIPEHYLFSASGIACFTWNEMLMATCRQGNMTWRATTKFKSEKKKKGEEVEY